MIDNSELRWFKSSYSDGPNGNDCVEIAATPTTVHVRDSKDSEGACLAFGPAAWAGFVAHASDGS
ncbi:DUF397 domain-containing protein [Streptomyces roseicoloratus]|uniref:DUF397 domain-containing protein n=1 Tax=Streptomyces roseicoloratus TaxID=2508722 RepID=A0ABY9RTS4_9ACTN|nr:DUF397 domain-containing protein [Streptomyces roseicoloratus]WMX45597.1 DUF397 domain-containing protein [Streptomyces roseicoloratus]